MLHYQDTAQPVFVKADEYALEDAVTHVLRNAQRHRLPGSAIEMTLQVSTAQACLHIANQGPVIAQDRLSKIFEYGVSDQPESGTQQHRGQGLFVAKTYLAKMGGTLGVRNLENGVSFLLTLQRA